VAILAIGATVQNALKAATLLEEEGISAEVVNMRFVKPIDAGLIEELAHRFNCFVTVEDNTIKGGFGSAVAECLASKQITDVRLKIHGIPDRFIDHGTPDELYREVGIDPQGIAAVVREFLHAGRTAATQAVRAIAN
jgi:1-deoxy-D-xylulose-5-phosphate synthase